MNFEIFGCEFSLDDGFVGAWLFSFKRFDNMPRSLMSFYIHNGFINLDLFFVHILEEHYIRGD